MYKTFFNLQRNPFQITPDPSFLFPTKRHNEALSSLYYGVRHHKGFVVMTGEVGTGKTLLVRCLLQLLNRDKVAYAYVFNNRLSPIEFLQYVMGDLGFTTTGKNKSELLLELSSYLIARHQKDLTTVLVVDEAHHLSGEVLEEIRLLTNLETAEDKLLQIMLVGQPELDQQLDAIELRQLKQRIALRTQLEPLNREETKGYIHRRLELAGAETRAEVLFPPFTVNSVYRYSHGIPRLINTVCENGLITAYAKQSPAVLPSMIDEVATDFRIDGMHSAWIDRGENIERRDSIQQGENTERRDSIQQDENIERRDSIQDEDIEQDESNEIWEAKKTMLRLYDQLRASRSDRGQSADTIPLVTDKA